MSGPSACKPPYRLMPHVYVCARDDYVVLMDAEHGKYLAIDGRQSWELGQLIEGWPSSAYLPLIRDRGASAQMVAADRVVKQLLQRNLLTDDSGIGKTAVPVRAPASLQTFPIFALDRQLRRYLRYLPTFIVACVRARRLRRHFRLSSVVDHLKARRLRWGERVAGMEELERLVRAHHHLRPLVYTWQDQCLYDSMVLLEFLAAYRMDATWVFGIHTWPWIPHCWVRVGTYLLNDTPGNIGRYSTVAEF